MPPPRSSNWQSWLVAVCVVLCPASSDASGPYRTPAEIELRRSEIAARLAAMADEESVLTARLAATDAALASAASAAERPALERGRIELAVCIQRLVEERDALRAEASELAETSTRTATGPLTRADPHGLTPAQVGGGGGQVSAGNAFNPAITLIPNGVYFYEAGRGRAASADIPRGFSLREVELALSGAVDPYFDVWATFAIGEDAIEAEEVFVQTRRFLPGAQVKFGRFLSGVGHLNRQHPHQWDFVDSALPYEALFGSSLAEVGVQVTWLPALPVYTQFGFEALQGDNPLIASQLADHYADVLEEKPGPRLFTGFLKVSPDLGYSNTLQAGLSMGRSRSHQEADPSADSDPSGQVYDGTSWFLGTDWIWRYDSARPFGEGDVTVQGEYLYRSKTLRNVSDLAAPGRTAAHDGAYAQMVYGLAPRWTVAGRIDTAATTRYSANATFNPTEFSRLRIQYNYSRMPDSSRARVQQLFVQFQMSLGVHGAHTF